MIILFLVAILAACAVAFGFGTEYGLTIYHRRTAAPRHRWLHAIAAAVAIGRHGETCYYCDEDRP